MANILLSILIPTTPDREPFMVKLREEINRQIELNNLQFEVEILEEHDNKEHTIGWKRNRLLERASGKYVAFVDSDDRLAPNYFKDVFEGIYKDVDCCSLTGIITGDGKNPKKFVHSMLYSSYFEEDNVYYRPNNHLNVIRANIAKQFKFPEKNFSEDTEWAMQICNSGVLKTEHFIHNVIYYYDFISNK